MKKTYLFYGAPGSGKGTQVGLLEKYLIEQENKKVLKMGMGNRLREFIEKGSLASKKTKEIVSQGELVPSFLPAYLLFNFALTEINDEDTILLDGVIRNQDQVEFMYDMFNFLEIEPFIFILNVPKEELKARLIKRGRDDDLREDVVEARIKVFDEETIKCVDKWKEKNVKVIEINGLGTIEEVSERIRKNI